MKISSREFNGDDEKRKTITITFNDDKVDVFVDTIDINRRGVIIYSIGKRQTVVPMFRIKEINYSSDDTVLRLKGQLK